MPATSSALTLSWRAISPTHSTPDVVNAQDYTFPLSPEKIPELMGRAILNGFSIDLVFVPFWNGATLPGPRWFGSGLPLAPV